VKLDPSIFVKPEKSQISGPQQLPLSDSSFAFFFFIFIFIFIFYFLFFIFAFIFAFAFIFLFFVILPNYSKSIEQTTQPKWSGKSLDSKPLESKKTIKGKEEVPEIIAIGRALLSKKLVQTSKEDHERWSKFIVGFTKAVEVADRQIRVLGRIRTYRKWLPFSCSFCRFLSHNLNQCSFSFTSDQVLKAIRELEPDIKSKKQEMELADLLVKLSFFFPVVGGNSFKEKALYRFHADEAKFHEHSVAKGKLPTKPKGPQWPPYLPPLFHNFFPSLDFEWTLFSLPLLSLRNPAKEACSQPKVAMSWRFSCFSFFLLLLFSFLSWEGRGWGEARPSCQWKRSRRSKFEKKEAESTLCKRYKVNIKTASRYTSERALKDCFLRPLPSCFKRSRLLMVESSGTSIRE